MSEIVLYGDPVLRKTAVRVQRFDDELKKFAADLASSMKEHDGVGLAANQVGRAIAVAAIDVTQNEEPPRVLINPSVIWQSDETEESEEGCLSFPEIRLKITRPKSVSVRAQDVDGNEFTIEKAEGLASRALQHEIDHLNGIMFIDRCSVLQRKLIEGKLKKLAKSRRSGEPAA